MSDVRNELKYTEEHEWVLLHADGTATIGITDYAQSSLGELVFVELPEVGSTFDQNEELAVVESVKAASEIYAPLSCEILEVNKEIEEAPELINHHPYDDAWIARVKITEEKELVDLMSADDYREFIEELV